MGWVGGLSLALVATGSGHGRHACGYTNRINHCGRLCDRVRGWRAQNYSRPLTRAGSRNQLTAGNSSVESGEAGTILFGQFDQVPIGNLSRLIHVGREAVRPEHIRPEADSNGVFHPRENVTGGGDVGLQAGLHAHANEPEFT